MSKISEKNNNSNSNNKNLYVTQDMGKQFEKDINALKQRMKNNLTIVRNNSDIANFASTAKIAEEIEDGFQRCYFNNVGKSLVFKYGSTPISSCIQIGTKDNYIKNVNEISFNNGNTFKGIIHDLNGIDSNDYKFLAPSVQWVVDSISPDILTLNMKILSIETKLKTIDINDTTVIIDNNLQINGEISCEWLNNEFSKYSLITQSFVHFIYFSCPPQVSTQD